MNFRNAFLASGLLAAFAFAGPTLATEVQHIDYKASLAGITIARASIDVALGAQSYKIDSRFKSAGLAHVVSEMTAETSTTGKLADGRAIPENYVLVFRKGKKSRTYTVIFADGGVVSSRMDPPRKKIPKNWVDVSEADRKGVNDPLTGLLRPAAIDPCSGKLPIYDGDMRFDLELAPKGKKAIVTEGFSGEAQICSVRFVPRSGFRQGRDDLDYLKELTAMEIWFSQSSHLPSYLPVLVTVPTRFGALRIEAVPTASD